MKPVNTDLDSLERLVENGWSLAVFEATSRFAEFRPSVLQALHSRSPEVRSAAVAVLNEADDSEAHDLVVALAHDPDAGVRDEVLEYIAEFPRETDASALLKRLVDRSQVFLASTALQKLFGDVGPLITDDEVNDCSEQISVWATVLEARGLFA